MAGPETRGSVFRTRKGGYGIRWPEDGKRPQQTGFATKTEARRWFAENVAPRLRARRARRPRSPSTPSATCFSRATAPPSSRATKATLEERLAPAARAVRRLDAARARGRRRRRRRLAGRPLRQLALPADVGAAAGARRRRALALHRAQPGRRRRPQPAAAREELQPFDARRGRRARRRARPRVRAARHLRRRDRAADERVGRARAPRRRPAGPRRHRPAPRTRTAC